MKFASLLTLLVPSVSGVEVVTDATACEHSEVGSPKADTDTVPSAEAYADKLKTLDLDALETEMIALLKTNNDCWPADQGNYGPFMIRLAWHCSGTYRNTDGAGGCAGGRIRFEPERSWGDNANLDKARALLYPLKAKYGDALSWGDLFVLAGTTAYRQSGTPIKKMCFGRMDEPNGAKSNVLLNEPLGASEAGLIYVDAQGPKKEGVAEGDETRDPVASAKEIRETFNKMGAASDRAIVALIGGGHTVGKTHGACSGAGVGGKSIKDAYAADPAEEPWKGTCAANEGSPVGMGLNTVTSGFEGYWTTMPFKWDNEFFKYMTDDKEWEQHTGPGGNQQWKIKGAAVGSAEAMLMRLTTDIALTKDAEYLKIVQEFANNQTSFDIAFDSAWFDLTHKGSGTWSTAVKCDGDGEVPEWLKMRDDDAPTPAPAPTTTDSASVRQNSIHVMALLSFACASIVF